MKFLVYGVLFIIAAALVVGLVIGVAFELIGLLFSALLVVAVVTFVMNKIRRPAHRDRLRGPGPTERLR
jgi:predicted membrane protein